MNITIILAIAVAVAILVIIFMAKFCRGLQDEKTRLEMELGKQKSISKELCEYVKQITKINGDEKEVAEKIKEAENDEELMAIIAGLVRTNNNRVCDKAKG